MAEVATIRVRLHSSHEKPLTDNEKAVLVDNVTRALHAFYMEGALGTDDIAITGFTVVPATAWSRSYHHRKE